MTALAREYGEGLYELARDEDIRPQVNQELTKVVDCLESQPEYIRLLASHSIERDERLKAVDEAFGGRVHPYIVSFMKLLTERGKIESFLDCVKWFHSRYNEDYGIVEAQVTSAVALSENSQNALKAKLEAMTGKIVSLILHVDSELIGGLRVEMNGRRYDNSIQNRLDRLKHSLVESL